MMEPIANQIDENNIISERPMACFWRRIIAFILDYVILFIIGNFLGLLFERQFAALGAFGSAVGFIITTVYFGFLDSYLGKGQSLGKRVFKIQVINGDGHYLPLGKSFGRAAILAIPLTLLPTNMPSMSLSFRAIFSLIQPIMLVSLLYFYIFNRITRQSLHDLLTNSFVLRVNALQPINDRIWPKHYIICFTLVLIIFVGGFNMQYRLIKNNSDLTMIQDLRSELLKINGIDNVGVSLLNMARVNDAYKFRDLNVVVLIHDNSIPLSQLEETIAKTILEKYPQSHDVQEIHIRISYGYNIGITKKYTTFVVDFSPHNWQQRIHAIEKNHTF